MKAHDLARALLAGPNLEVAFRHPENPDWAEVLVPGEPTVMKFWEFPADGERAKQVDLVTLSPNENVLAYEPDMWPELDPEGNWVQG